MDDFPIQIPERLPTRITPCPITEAVAEFRFVTSESWQNIPGYLARSLRKRFSQENPLPLNSAPEDIKRIDPSLKHKPHIQYLSERFIVQLGPQVVSLSTRGGYHGWTAFRAEIEWLLDQVKAADFVQEGERIGLRYIDFFEGNLFDHLDATLMFGNASLTGPELSLTKVMRRNPFQARLVLNNSATILKDREAVRGGVLDLDVSIGPQDFDLFENGLEKLDLAHHLNKQVFFGLLKPDFLQTLNPEYQ